MDLSQVNLFQIAILVVGLAVVWIVLRTVLKLAMRVLATGCGLILLSGVVLVVINAFR